MIWSSIALPIYKKDTKRFFGLTAHFECEKFLFCVASIASDTSSRSAHSKMRQGKKACDDRHVAFLDETGKLRMIGPGHRNTAFLQHQLQLAGWPSHLCRTLSAFCPGLEHFILRRVEPFASYRTSFHFILTSARINHLSGLIRVGLFRFLRKRQG